MKEHIQEQPVGFLTAQTDGSQTDAWQHVDLQQQQQQGGGRKSSTTGEIRFLPEDKSIQGAKKQLLNEYVWQRALHRNGEAQRQALYQAVKRSIDKHYQKAWMAHKKRQAFKERQEERRKEPSTAPPVWIVPKTLTHSRKVRVKKARANGVNGDEATPMTDTNRVDGDEAGPSQASDIAA